MPVVVRDGADLYWNKTGAGPALILGAGLNGSGKWWDPNRLALPSGSPSTPSTSVAPGAHPRYRWRRSSRWLRTWSRSWTTPVLNRRITPAIRPAAALVSPPYWISQAGCAHC